MRTLIQNAIIVNEGQCQKGSLVIDNDRISRISDAPAPPHEPSDLTVDATGCFVIPGVIDSHVHFREPGLTAKADIESESRAAAFGGVTSFFDMPNTVPQTVTPEALDEKFALAREKSHINYSFFFGATNSNAHLFDSLDAHHIPGIKLFMGSSTGNMLVDKHEVLMQIFEQTKLPIVAHCEDTAIISDNVKRMTDAKPTDDLPIWMHPLIRSEEACYESSFLAVQLAKTFGTRLHVAHVSTACELEMFGEFSNITAEAVVAHLLFSQYDYKERGALIKCNPAIKREIDRDALREALTTGQIFTIATDHAPHRLDEKQGGALRAMSGMPMIQFSLVSMLRLVDEGFLTIERMVELMCHNPARLFEVQERGFLRPGYKADIAIVRPGEPWTLTPDLIQSRCGWSPLTGEQFRWRVEHTFCNGQHIYNKGVFMNESHGEEIRFR